MVVTQQLALMSPMPQAARKMEENWQKMSYALAMRCERN